MRYLVGRCDILWTAVLSTLSRRSLYQFPPGVYAPPLYAFSIFLQLRFTSLSLSSFFCLLPFSLSFPSPRRFFSLVTLPARARRDTIDPTLANNCSFSIVDTHQIYIGACCVSWWNRLRILLAFVVRFLIGLLLFFMFQLSNILRINFHTETL